MAIYGVKSVMGLFSRRDYSKDAKLIAAGAFLFLGCAHGYDSLKPGVQRVCTPSICFIYGSAEQIDRRCRKGTQGFWDDGTPQRERDGRRARCCTQYYPERAKRKFSIWISRDGYDQECIAHEFCHVELYEKYGLFADHGQCHNFGLKKEGVNMR